MFLVMLTLTPIFLLIVSLFWFKWPLSKAAPFTFIYTLLLVWFHWPLPTSTLLALIFKSGLLTLDVILILFGAILFLALLREHDLISPMQDRLGEISQKKSIQAFLLAWLFGSFLEGISGFGTPAAIIAPLLVGLGFAPLQAVLLSLVANSTAVVFGAVGTPIRIGLASLDVSDVATQAAYINLLTGWLVPIMMLAIVSNNFHEFRKGIIPALAAGMVFLFPYYFFSHLGSEFPSIFGGAIGLTIAFLFLKPKHVSLSALMRAFSPYLLLVAVLVLGKMIFMNFSFILDLAPGLKHSLNLFNPGFSFLTAVLILSFKRSVNLKPLVIKSTLSLQKAAIGIFFTSALSYLMILSGLLETLSSFIVSRYLPLYAAGIGAFGSFLAGSATVSNLLFGEIQSLTADKLGFKKSLVLGLQLVGAGIGNMIALSNIVAVQAAVGMTGKEATILKRLLIPCGLYLLLVGLLGFYYS